MKQSKENTQEVLRAKIRLGQSNDTDPDNPKGKKLSIEETRNRKKVDNVIRKEQKVKSRAVPKS